MKITPDWKTYTLSGGGIVSVSPDGKKARVTMKSNRYPHTGYAQDIGIEEVIHVKRGIFVITVEDNTDIQKRRTVTLKKGDSITCLDKHWYIIENGNGVADIEIHHIQATGTTHLHL